MNDVRAACRAFELVFKEYVNYHQSNLEKVWENSSVKIAIEEKSKNCQKNLKNLEKENVVHALREFSERISMIGHSLRVYVTTSYCKHFISL